MGWTKEPTKNTPAKHMFVADGVIPRVNGCWE